VPHQPRLFVVGVPIRDGEAYNTRPLLLHLEGLLVAGRLICILRCFVMRCAADHLVKAEIETWVVRLVPRRAGLLAAAKQAANRFMPHCFTRHKMQGCGIDFSG